jgi:hypothetical protein
MVGVTLVSGKDVGGGESAQAGESAGFSDGVADDVREGGGDGGGDGLNCVRLAALCCALSLFLSLCFWCHALLLAFRADWSSSFKVSSTGEAERADV